MTDAQLKAKKRAEESGIQALQITHRSPVKDLRAHVIALHGVIDRTNTRIENIRKKAEEEEMLFVETNGNLIQEIHQLLSEISGVQADELRLRDRLKQSKLAMQNGASHIAFLHQRSSIQSMTDLGGDDIRAPESQVAVVMSDIEGCGKLFDIFGAEKTEELIIMHNRILLEELHKLQGYEVKNESDVFLVVFQNALEAVRWCLSVQSRMMRTEWPEWLQDYPQTAKQWRMEKVVEPAKFEKVDEDEAAKKRRARRRGRTVAAASAPDTTKPTEGEEQKEGEEGAKDEPKAPQFIQKEMLWNGPRVRMGVFSGEPTRSNDSVTGRVAYSGPVMDKAKAIQAIAHGGQIVACDATVRQVRSKAGRMGHPVITSLGNVSIHGHKHAEALFTIMPDALQNRELPPPPDPPREPSLVRNHEDFHAVRKEASIDHSRSIKLIGTNKELMTRTQVLQRRMEFLLSEYATNMALLKSQTKAEQKKFEEGERVLNAKQSVISALLEALKSRFARLEERFAHLGPPFDRIPVLEQEILALIAEKRRVRQQRQEERNGYAQEMSVILHHLSRFREEYMRTVEITNEILEWKGQKLLKIPKGWNNPTLNEYYGLWAQDPKEMQKKRMQFQEARRQDALRKKASQRPK